MHKAEFNGRMRWTVKQKLVQPHIFVYFNKKINRTWNVF